MAEASLTQNALSLRSLFAMFLDFNHPEDALGLWTAHRNAMMEDKVYHAHRNGHGTPDTDEMENAVLWDVECILNQQTRSLRDFGWVTMPTPPTACEPLSSFLEQELELCRCATLADVQADFEWCNVDQRTAFQSVVDGFKCPTNERKCFFLYAAVWVWVGVEKHTC